MKSIKTKKIFILAFLAIFTSISNAIALDLVPVGIGTLSSNSLDTVTGVTYLDKRTGVAFGGGLLLYQRFLPSWEVSTGFVYMGNSGSFDVAFSQPVSGTIHGDTTYHMFRIPLLAHYEVLPSFKVGLGLFYDHGVGNVTGTQTTTIGGVATAVPIDKDWNTAGQNQDYMGLMVTGDYTTPITQMMDFFSSIRVAYGLTNMEKSTNTFAANQPFSSMHQFDINLYLGLKFASLFGF